MHSTHTTHELNSFYAIMDELYTLNSKEAQNYLLHIKNAAIPRHYHKKLRHISDVGIHHLYLMQEFFPQHIQTYLDHELNRLCPVEIARIRELADPEPNSHFSNRTEYHNILKTEITRRAILASCNMFAPL